MKLRRERKRSGERPYKSRLVSFREGMETLPRRLAEDTGARIRTGAALTAIDRAAEGWRLRWRDAGGEQEAGVDQLVVSVPANVIAGLPWPDEVAAACARVPALSFPPVTTLVLGYRREQVAHPLDGFGMLIPFVEHKRVLGAIFSSNLFPERAPAGHVSLMVFLGGARMPDCAYRELADAVALAQGELGGLLGITGEPVFARHHHWPAAIPQYNVGHGDFLAALAAIESRWPGLHFCANFRGGPGVSDCIDSAIRTSEHILYTLGDRPGATPRA
jgi:oxygen-dependent protoporphyrinogen oxidase